MKNIHQESLRAPRSRKGSVTHSEVRPRDRGDTEGRQATVGRGSGGGGATWVGPTITPGSLIPDKGVVSGCIPPFSAACSGNTQVDHGGAGRTIQLRPAPWGKCPHFRGAITGRRLSTYGGRDRGGSETPTKSPLRGPSGMRDKHLKGG